VGRGARAVKAHPLYIHTYIHTYNHSYGIESIKNENKNMFITKYAVPLAT
jgi:hypothetical protein